jgi:hypothetical protein
MRLASKNMPDSYHIAFQSVKQYIVFEDCAILIHTVSLFSEANNAANTLTHWLLNCCMRTIDMAQEIKRK